ncbi:MAG: hypothetical protein NVSMB9_25150 [Isosphaeraceae bacterium]
MAMIVKTYCCRWVCDRLPLMAGGELTGSDRRMVDRHLIACPACRTRKASLVGVLDVLHAAAGHSPVGRGVDGPSSQSLWPALARQIREARHEPRVSGLSSSLWASGSWLELFRGIPFVRFRPALAVALALFVGGLASAGLNLWTRSRPITSWTALNVAPPAVHETVPEAPKPLIASTVPPAPAPRASASSLAQTDLHPPSAERSAGARIDYDLDHGTPMGPGTRDTKPSY